MNFGEYLYLLRISHQPKKLTQGQVGNVIGATRQYIDALEKQKPGTTPPRWEQCLKIVTLLKLNDSEKRKFLWLAFKERNRHNIEFYSFFHGDEEPLTANRDSKSKKRFSTAKTGKKQKEFITYSCVYRVTIKSTDEALLNSRESHRTIEDAFQKQIQSLQHQVLDFQIDSSDHTVSFTVALSPLVILDSVVREIKNAVARELRAHGISAGHAQSIWSKYYTVKTLEAIETAPVVEIEKVTTAA